MSSDAWHAGMLVAVRCASARRRGEVCNGYYHESYGRIYELLELMAIIKLITGAEMY